MPFVPESAQDVARAAARRMGYWTLFVCLVNNGVANSMLFALLPPFARETGVSEMAIAATYVVAAGLFTVMSQVWGGLSDRIGRRPVIMFGLGGAAASMFAMSQTIALGRAGAVSAGLAAFMVIGSRAIFGFVNSAVGPAAMAWVADRSTPQTRTASISTLTAAFGFGAVAGPSVGAMLAPFLGLAGPFVVTGCIALLGVVAVRLFLPEQTPPADARPRKILDGWAMIGDLRLRDILLVSCGIWVVQAVGLQIIGFAVMDRLDLAGREAVTAGGIVLTAGAGASLVAQWLIIPRYKLLPHTALRSGCIITLMGCAGLAVSHTLPMMTLAFALQGLGLGLARPGAAAAASLAVEPDEQGIAAGLASATAGVGFLASAFMGTGVYQFTGATGAFLAAMVITALVLYASYRSPWVARASHRADPIEETDASAP